MSTTTTAKIQHNTIDRSGVCCCQQGRRELTNAEGDVQEDIGDIKAYCIAIATFFQRVFTLFGISASFRLHFGFIYTCVVARYLFPLCIVTLYCVGYGVGHILASDGRSACIATAILARQHQVNRISSSSSSSLFVR
jgi:hypothetical protein